MPHKPGRPRNLNQRLDPYPLFGLLREAGRVVRIQTAFAGEASLITRYEDAVALAGDPRLSPDSRHASPQVRRRLEERKFCVLNAFPDNMLIVDPPRHTRLRRLVAQHFTPRRMESLRPFVRGLVGGLLDALPDGEPADLVASLAAPLPHRVICHLLGVPPEDAEALRRWTLRITLLSVDEESSAAVAEGRREMWHYLRRLVKAKRAHRGDDLLSLLVHERSHSDRLSDVELISMAGLLFGAGTETTSHMIGNGVLLLLRNPGHLAALVEDPRLIPQSVEELLRLEGPITLGLIRYAVTDLPVGEHVIPGGDLVLVGLATANHDPRRFTDPESMDLSRAERGHLAFGKGIHYCLGAPLARIELQEVFTALLARHPRMRLAVPAEELRWGSAMLRGLDSLPVMLGDQPG